MYIKEECQLVKGRKEKLPMKMKALRQAQRSQGLLATRKELQKDNSSLLRRQLYSLLIGEHLILIQAGIPWQQQVP